MCCEVMSAACRCGLQRRRPSGAWTTGPKQATVTGAAVRSLELLCAAMSRNLDERQTAFCCASWRIRACHALPFHCLVRCTGSVLSFHSCACHTLPFHCLVRLHGHCALIPQLLQANKLCQLKTGVSRLNQTDSAAGAAPEPSCVTKFFHAHPMRTRACGPTPSCQRQPLRVFPLARLQRLVELVRLRNDLRNSQSRSHVMCMLNDGTLGLAARATPVH